MLQDGFVAKKYRKIRFWIIALALVAGLAVIGGAAALRLTKHPDYWLNAAGLLVAVLLPIIAQLRSAAVDSSPDRLNKVERDLAAAVCEQWSKNVARISDPYPLEVPFSVLTKATVDPSDFHSETEGKTRGKGARQG